MRRTVTVFSAVLLALWPAAGQAQDNGKLTDAVDRLFTFGDCGVPVCLDVSSAHGSHFNEDAVSAQGLLVSFLQNSIARSISSLPLAAASGGAIYRPGPGGIPVLTETSAGPIFAERANTLGPGIVLFGVNVSGFSFSTLRGEDLDDLTLTLTHSDTPPEDGLPGNPPFENDLIRISADMNVSSLVGSFYAAYGVTDRVDLSIAVPIVRTRVHGTSLAAVEVRGDSEVHYFDEATGQTSAQSAVDESATGIGDIALRAKVNFMDPRAATGVGILADLRLGTGDEENFHGAGSTSFRALLIASGQYGIFGPHLNAGYQFRDSEMANNEFLVTVGTDVLATEGVTLAADLIGTFETDDSPLSLPGPQQFLDGSMVTRTNLAEKRDHLLDLALGSKVSPTEGLNLIGNVLVPLNTERGLRPNVGWTLGVEYSFGT